MTSTPRRTRRFARVGTVAAALLAILLVMAPAASAHPLGNFTVNSYSGLRVEPTAIAIQLVVDSAEIPTLQTFPEVNQDGAIPQRQLVDYRTSACHTLVAGIQLSVSAKPVTLSIDNSTLSFPPGSAGLHTMRLTCDVRTSTPVDTVGKRVDYRDSNSIDRVGWREITATGDGVQLAASDVPTTSTSAMLTAYPANLLASPLNQQTATLEIGKGTGVVNGGGTAVSDPSSPLPRGVDRLTTAFTNLVASRNLTAGFGILAVFLAVILGGMHAFAPGHGKTLMAAYLVGRQSSLRQAATIGLSVTLTHTFGVLALGVLLSVVAVAAPERVYPWLGLASGLMLISIGATLLRRVLRARSNALLEAAAPTLELIQHADRQAADPVRAVAGSSGKPFAARTGTAPRSLMRTPDVPRDATGHGHGHSHAHAHTHDATEQAHTHGAEVPGMHSHGLFSHTHLPPAGSEKTGARSLLAVGFAGGLVPSPSALVVLLGGIALGRTWFGVLLVLAYGIGMALALVGTGLLLVKARDRLQRWAAATERSKRSNIVLLATRALPALTAILVLGLGASVAIRGFAGIVGT